MPVFIHVSPIQFSQNCVCTVFSPQDVLSGKPKYFHRKSPQVPVYLETDDQQNTLFNHLWGILDRNKPPGACPDKINCILEVLFPEVYIHI